MHFHCLCHRLFSFSPDTIAVIPLRQFPLWREARQWTGSFFLTCGRRTPVKSIDGMVQSQMSKTSSQSPGQTTQGLYFVFRQVLNVNLFLSSLFLTWTFFCLGQKLFIFVFTRFKGACKWIRPWQSIDNRIPKVRHASLFQKNLAVLGFSKLIVSLRVDLPVSPRSSPVCESFRRPR